MQIYKGETSSQKLRNLYLIYITGNICNNFTCILNQNSYYRHQSFSSLSISWFSIDYSVNPYKSKCIGYRYQNV